MVSGIGGITSQAIELALNGLSLRHNAIASNIANSNTAGYRPIQVEFENKIAEMLASQNSANPSLFASPQAEPQISFGHPQAGSGTTFEMNTVMLNQNVLQYQTLIKGLNAYMATISEAVKEGKR